MEKTGPKVSCYGRRNLTGACQSTTDFPYFNVFLLLFSSFPPDSLDTCGKSMCALREGRIKGRGRTYMKVDEARVPTFSQSDRSLCMCLCVRDLTGI